MTTRSTDVAGSVVCRPNITGEIVGGLGFARACVLDQRAASHARDDHSFDTRYTDALDSIEVLLKAYQQAISKAARKAAKKAAR